MNIISDSIIYIINDYLYNYDKAKFAVVNKNINNFFINKQVLKVNISDKTYKYILKLYKNIDKLIVYFDNNVNTISNILFNIQYKNLKTIEIKPIEETIEIKPIEETIEIKPIEETIEIKSIEETIYSNYTILNKPIKNFILLNTSIINIYIENCSALSDFTILYILEKCVNLYKIQLINCNSLTKLSLDKIY
jgi:hypothetical protein